MNVGIKDVARVAAVSPATVSRVLAGRPVDPDMRDRVMAAVHETGYRPNLAARRLRSRHTNTIGLIVADIRNPFFTAVSRTVEAIAYDRGLRVIFCNTDEDAAKEAMYLQLMQEERVTGVILAPTREGADRIAHVESDFPIVLIDRAAPNASCDSVVIDNAAMAAKLVVHLHRLGHRRIAGLFGTDTVTGRERCDGYRRAMEECGIPGQVVPVPHEREQAQRVIAALLEDASRRPSALVVSNSVMLQSVLRVADALELEIPRDLALTSFDNEPWMEFVGGGLSVIEQPVEEIGRTAVTMLMDRLDHADCVTRRVVLAGRFIARGSGGRGVEA
ncbi:LacI family DNA-binding transcriptional regulator [Gluconacetobacter aggeris]|uniref:LacI family DNA-binding transcriptional regulator n=1 Tax=Gluconacetobacter aggeris TaxID=1286186 RepID=A0A7W4IR05_9PROT|nr:LacI family DNA-binding transcriptional regulator [Gluconacetobacter aggeris]MBB2167358.1 LacI family DNA-binding transcriptional regulator [Gluconacetobacter aggeris]